jgi:hypothetical protein
VPLAANINSNVKLCLHERSLYFAMQQDKIVCAPCLLKSHASLASSRQALQTMRMTGAAFQAEPSLANQAGPLSHTPVSTYRTPHDRFLHLANLESRPV